MNFIDSMIWVLTSVVTAIVVAVLVTAIVGGEFFVFLLAGFFGGMAGIYMFEYARVDISFGNKYLDQAVISVVGSLAFILVVAFLGTDALHLD